MFRVAGMEEEVPLDVSCVLVGDMSGHTDVSGRTDESRHTDMSTYIDVRTNPKSVSVSTTHALCT